MLDFIIGMLYVLLYSIPLAIGLFIFYFPISWVFSKIKIKNFILKSIIVSYIFSFFGLLFLFFFPSWFLGMPLHTFDFAQSFWDKLYVFLLVVLHILYIDIYISLLEQPVILIFVFLREKWNEKHILLRVFVPIYIISAIILFINMLFPWIVGGLILMLFK